MAIIIAIIAVIVICGLNAIAGNVSSGGWDD